MTQISVSNQAKIPVRMLTETKRKALEKLCTVDNPEYFNELTFKGWVKPDIPQHFTAFSYKDDNIYIPRGAVDNAALILGNTQIKYKTSYFEKVGFSFQKEMQVRPYQDEAVEALLKHETGILVSPTGSGKTNIGLKVIEKLNQPTLILIHRDHLLDQWKSRIEEYFGYRPGIIGSGRWMVKNITIAMIPTLHANPKKARKLRKRFGLVFIDECHHIPAYSWLNMLTQFDSHRIYGCSATPKRKDGLQKIMTLAVGPIRHVLQDQKAVSSGAITPVKVNVIRTPYQGWMITNKVGFNALAKDLIHDENRNKLIIKYLVENTDKTQMVLSDRIDHLKLLLEMARDTGKLQCDIIVGAVSVSKRKEVFKRIEDGETNVLFASSVADEGLDLPILDTLHLAFPTANPERNMQQIGRIRRPYPHKTEAIVYDYFDWKNPTLNRQFQGRKRKYRSNSFKIEFIGELI